MSDRQALTDIICDERTLKLILHESRLSALILFDPRSIERLVRDGDFLATLADSDSVLDYLRRHHLLLNRLLDDEELLARISRDSRLRAITDIKTPQQSARVVRQQDPQKPQLPATSEALEPSAAAPSSRFKISERELAGQELERCWNQFLPHLDPNHGEFWNRFDTARAQLESRDQIPDALARILSDDGMVHLRGGAFSMVPKSDLADHLYQVFVSTRYFFEASTDAPRILDCGAGTGLASHYFKTLYPNARITAVEPAPHLRSAARSNFKRSGHDDIETLTCVLSKGRGVQAFHLHPDSDRGGTLLEQTIGELASRKSINVRARPLSDLLRDPVDYLRLDVGGIEADLLVEAELQLANVAHLFVEVHETGSAFAERLARIFAVLQRSGFKTRVVPTEEPTKHFSQGRVTAPRRRREVLGIWARRSA